MHCVRLQQDGERPAQARAAVDADVPVLVVEVGGHRCGLPAAAVREVHRMVAVVPVPGAPAVVDGVVDVRGEIVPVLELRARLGLPRRVVTPDDQLVLVGAASRVLGVRVDAVADLVLLSTAVVQAGDDLRWSPHLDGVVRTGDGLLLALDPVSFLLDDEAADLGRALAEIGALGTHDR